MTTPEQLAAAYEELSRDYDEMVERLRERMENAGNALPDPMHPSFPYEFVDAQARGLAWLDDEASAALGSESE